MLIGVFIFLNLKLFKISFFLLKNDIDLIPLIFSRTAYACCHRYLKYCPSPFYSNEMFVWHYFISNSVFYIKIVFLYSIVDENYTKFTLNCVQILNILYLTPLRV